MVLQLADVIAQVESDGYAHAIRFEQSAWSRQWNAATHTSYEPVIARIRAIHHNCSAATADMICFSSFGMFRETGCNIYGMYAFAYDHDVVEFCSNVNAQRDAFQQFTQFHGIDYSVEEIMSDPAKMLRLATVYNGPGMTEAYSARIRDVVRRMSA